MSLQVRSKLLAPPVHCVARLLVLLTVALLAACAGGRRGAGAHCISSEQCETGLLCDTTQKPAVCAANLGQRPSADGAVSTYDLAGQDLSGVDLAGDLSAAAPDLKTPPDLAPFDGG